MGQTVRLVAALVENIGSAALTTCTVLPLSRSALKRLILFTPLYTRIYSGNKIVQILQTDQKNHIGPPSKYSVVEIDYDIVTMFIFSNKREDYFPLLLMGVPPATALLHKSDGQLGVLGFVLEAGTGMGWAVRAFNQLFENMERHLCVIHQKYILGV